MLSCTKTASDTYIENTGYAQGTTYQIKYESKTGKDFESEVKNIFAAIDSSMSTYLPGSFISRVNEGGVMIEADSLFLTVLNRSLEIAEETDGAFDPTIGPLVHLWGFGFEEVRQDVTQEMIDEAKANIGYKHIRRNEDTVGIPKGFALDFNAIAQGFTVDHLARFLEQQGIENYMIEVGGEIRTSGRNAEGQIWKIGVDKPQEQIDYEDRFQFILELDNAALATSGNYRKFWVDEESGMKYSHTINPKTGRPAFNSLLSASIIAASAMDADAYATACMVMGLKDCRDFITQKENLEAYLVYADSTGAWKTYLSPGFKNYLAE